MLLWPEAVLLAAAAASVAFPVGSSPEWRTDQESAKRAKRDVTGGELEALLKKAGAGEYIKDKEFNGNDGEVFLMHEKAKPENKVAVKVDKGSGASNADSLKNEVKLLRTLDKLSGFPKLIFPKPETTVPVGVLESEKKTMIWFGGPKKFDFFIESQAGPHIGTLLKHNKISIEQAKHIIIELAEIFQRLHTKNIAHMDPFFNNICISRDNLKELVLIDFGTSQAADKMTEFGKPGYFNDWEQLFVFSTFLLSQLKFKPTGKFEKIEMPGGLFMEFSKAAGIRDQKGNYIPVANLPKADKIAESFLAYAREVLGVAAGSKIDLTSWKKDEKIDHMTNDEVWNLKDVQRLTG